jgi:hypothetical protein
MSTQRFMQTWILAWITRTKYMQRGDFGDFGPFFNTEKGLCTYQLVLAYWFFLFSKFKKMQKYTKKKFLGKKILH